MGHSSSCDSGDNGDDDDDSDHFVRHLIRPTTYCILSVFISLCMPVACLPYSARPARRAARRPLVVQSRVIAVLKVKSREGASPLSLLAPSPFVPSLPPSPLPIQK